MAVIHLTTADFDNTVSNGKVLVDFWATWCMPCKMLAPTIEDLAEDFPQAKVCKVDVDKEPALAARFGVMSIPTVLIFENGELVEKFVGVRAYEDYAEILNG